MTSSLLFFIIHFNLLLFHSRPTCPAPIRPAFVKHLQTLPIAIPSRRQLNESDESAYSMTSSMADDARVALRYLAAADLEKLPEAAILSRSLNVKSVISTTSTFAQRFQQAASRPELQSIVQIGEGLQATIFEQIGLSHVIKKEKPGNDALRSNLKHEFSLHEKVWAAFDRYQDLLRTRVHVPRLFDYIPKTDNHLWNQISAKLPEGDRIKTDMVRMERILPMPKVVRKALAIMSYPRLSGSVDKPAIDAVITSPPNKHCLVRTYLGKKEARFSAENFFLRNFPLCLNAMQTIGLDLYNMAYKMGQAYSIMHWGAGVNGDDVEFVLGTSATQKPDQPYFQHRQVGLYLLDFGQCDEVDLGQETHVVYQGFKGAMVIGDNQLFIPHYEKSPELFGAFKRGYVETSNIILKDKGLQDKFNIHEFMREYEEYAEDFLI